MIYYYMSSSGTNLLSKPTFQLQHRSRRSSAFVVITVSLKFRFLIFACCLFGLTSQANYIVYSIFTFNPVVGMCLTNLVHNLSLIVVNYQTNILKLQQWRSKMHCYRCPLTCYSLYTTFSQANYIVFPFAYVYYSKIGNRTHILQYYK